MSRTIIKIPFSDYQQANDVIRSMLSSRGFKERFQDGNQYWQKGQGFLSAPMCLQFDFSETEITVQAWISNLGVESDLSGLVGVVPKRQLLEVIELLKHHICQQVTATKFCIHCGKPVNAGSAFCANCGNKVQ